MIPYRFRVPAFVFILAAAGLGTARAHGATAAPPALQDRGGWDAPPGEYNEIQRRGFHDGMEGARKDYENHRRADVNNRDEYRHPHVPPELQDAYREGFRRGYDRAMEHFVGAHDHHDHD